jgi:hypothetical protein
MAVDWGGMVYDEEGQTQAGVPLAIWDSWMPSTQDMYLEDYFRTDAQQNYSTNLDPYTGLAYAYTGIVDHYTGLEAVEIGESANETYRVALDTVPKALNIAGEGALLLGLGALALLLGRK